MAVDRMNLGDSILYNIDRTRQLVQSLEFGGIFHTELYRNGEIINVQDIHNTVTDAAKLQFLNAFFMGGPVNTTPWQMGLIDGGNFSSVSPTDSTPVHNGWSELTSYYYNDDPGTHFWRQHWIPGPAYVGKTSNSIACDFDFTADGLVQGIFILGGGSVTGNLAMKGDWSSDGYGLLSTCLFPSALPVQNLDILKIFYTIQI